jgi:hypothetical protein
MSNKLQKAENAVKAGRRKPIAEAAVSNGQAIVSDFEVKRTACVQHGAELANAHVPPLVQNWRA